MSARRRAFTLLEVLLSLPLMALLAIVTVHLVLSIHRQVLSSDAVVLTTRELRQGANVLAAEWRTLHPSDLVAWTDTSIEFQGTVAVGTICSSLTPRRSLAVLADNAAAMSASSPLTTQVHQSIQPGDLAHLWIPGRTPLDSLRDTVVHVAAVSHSTDCTRSVLGHASLGSLRITLGDSLTAMPAFGTPVRLTRRTRYSLYRSGDGQWYLGRRTLGSAGWDVIQPVSGPLRAPRDSGLVLSLWTTRGNRMASNGAMMPGAVVRNAVLDSLLPVRIRMHMRALRLAGNGTSRQPATDSLSIDVTLRSFTGARQ